MRQRKNNMIQLNDRLIQVIYERANIVAIAKHLQLQEIWLHDLAIDTVNRFAPFDAKWISGGTVAIVEYKQRNYASDRFEDWAIETKKANSLLDYLDDDIKHVHYINQFSDGVTAIWDLTYELLASSRQETTKEKWYNLTADDQRNDHHKHVTYLSLSRAQIC